MTSTDHGDSTTHFTFEHKVFSIQGSYFVKDRDGDRVNFVTPLAEVFATIPVGALCEEFGLAPDSSDGRLLELVTQGVNYVKIIRPNDSIPQELLDGSASWSVDDRHRRTADGRLTVQLVTRLMGREEHIGDLSRLEQLLNDPNIQKQLPDAVNEVVIELGMDPTQKSEIIDKIDRLGHEFSFIEGLREHFDRIKTIIANCHALARLPGGSERTIESVARIHALADPVFEEITIEFDLLDAQTCEILPVLRSLDHHIEVIRTARDKLHQRFMIWDDILAEWEGFEVEGHTDEAIKLVDSTYRFLAQNFAQINSWTDN